MAVGAEPVAMAAITSIYISSFFKRENKSYKYWEKWNKYTEGMEIILAFSRYFR